MKVEPKRSKFKKETISYQKDNVLDIIDIAGSLNKTRFTPKTPIDTFIFKKELTNYHTPNSDNKSPFSHSKSRTSINYDKLNNNKFKINFKSLILEYPNGYHINFTSNYFPIEILGQGSFGLVISAINLKNKEPKAIKIIDKSKFGRNAESDYLFSEVEIVQSLNHPRILKIFEVLNTSKYFFIFMELIEGGSLKDMMIKRYADKSREYLFRESESAIIMKGLLEALDYLHKKNIIHRDIKPDNIMFKSKDDLNSVILCDFGLSYQLTTYYRFIDSRCGTLLYMAPEMIANRKYDHLVDSFSAGIVLYLLISGGKHPIYKKGMNQEDFKKAISKKEDFTFVESISLIARNLFLKLTKYEPFYRYAIYKALKHPWITRSASSEIPLTLIDEYERLDKINSFKALLMVTMFFEMFKGVYKLNRKSVKNDISKSSPMKRKEKILNDLQSRSPFKKDGNLLIKPQDKDKEKIKIVKTVSNSNSNFGKLKSNGTKDKVILKAKSKIEFKRTLNNKGGCISPSDSKVENNYICQSPKTSSKTLNNRKIVSKDKNKNPSKITNPLSLKTDANSNSKQLKETINKREINMKTMNMNINKGNSKNKNLDKSDKGSASNSKGKLNLKQGGSFIINQTRK